MKHSTLNLHIPILAFFLLLTSTSQAFTPKLIPYRKGELWGYCDRNKKIVVPCKYYETHPFRPDGLGMVYESFMSNCGLIDTLGNIVVPLKYSACQFRYFVVPYDGGREDKYGACDAYRWNDKLVVVSDVESMYTLDAHTAFILEDRDGHKFFDRSGHQILADSIQAGVSFPEHGQPLYFTGRSKTDNQTRLYDPKGRLLNSRTFDHINPLDSFHFAGKTGGNEGIYTLAGEELLSGDHNFHQDAYGPWISTNDNVYDISKRRFIAEGFRKAYKYYLFSDQFIVVPHRVDKGPISYTVLDRDLREFIPGVFDAAVSGTPFNSLFLYKGAGVSCYKLDGRKLFALDDADTIINISSTRYMVKTSGGYGIWSSTSNDFVVKPIYKALNYTLKGRLILLEQNGSYIVADSNGNYTPDDVYKHARVEVHELDYIPSQAPQAGVPLDALYFYKTEMSDHTDEDITSLNFIPYKKGRYIGTPYFGDDAEKLTTAYIGKVSCIVALKADGGTFVIDNAGRKISLGKTVEFRMKLGNIVIYKNLAIPGQLLSCMNMEGLAIKTIQFTETGDWFYYKGILHLALKKEKGNDHIFGLIDENGRIVYPVTYENIYSFTLNASAYFRDADSLERQRGYVAWAKTGIQVFMDDTLLCRIGPGLLVYEWLGEFGIVESTNPQLKGRGIINKYGKLIVPPIYDIESIGNGLIGVSRMDGPAGPAAAPDTTEHMDGDSGGKKFLGYFDMMGVKYFE